MTQINELEMIKAGLLTGGRSEQDIGNILKDNPELFTKVTQQCKDYADIALISKLTNVSPTEFIDKLSPEIKQKWWAYRIADMPIEFCEDRSIYANIAAVMRAIEFPHNMEFLHSEAERHHYRAAMQALSEQFHSLAKLAKNSEDFFKNVDQSEFLVTLLLKQKDYKNFNESIGVTYDEMIMEAIRRFENVSFSNFDLSDRHYINFVLPETLPYFMLALEYSARFRYLILDGLMYVLKWNDDQDYFLKPFLDANRYHGFMRTPAMIESAKKHYADMESLNGSRYPNFRQYYTRMGYSLADLKDVEEEMRQAQEIRDRVNEIEHKPGLFTRFLNWIKP